MICAASPALQASGAEHVVARRDQRSLYQRRANHADELGDVIVIGFRAQLKREAHLPRRSNSGLGAMGRAAAPDVHRAKSAGNQQNSEFRKVRKSTNGFENRNRWLSS